MPRPLLHVAVALVAGCCLGDRLPWAALAVLLAAAAVLLLSALRRPGRAVRCLLAATVGLGAAARGVEGRAYDAAPLRDFVLERPERDGPVCVRGRLSAEPRDLGDRWRLLVEVDDIEAEGRRVAARGLARIDVAGTFARPLLEDGDLVTIHAVLRAPRGSATPGVEDVADRARREGVHAWGSCKNPRLVETTGRDASPVTSALSATRRWARSRLVERMPAGPEQALVRALVLGDRDGLDDETSESFRRAGTYHVLAISGSQVALLIATLLALARLARLPAGAAALGIALVAAAYAGLVGGDTPVVRAALMAAVLLLGRWLDVRGDLVNLLAAAALVLVAWRPSQVGEASFQLTFAATLGLLVGGPRLAARLPRLPLRLELGLAASVAAQAALLPLLLVHFHRLAPAGLLLNVVAVPVSGLVMLLGLASLASSAVEPLARLLAELAWCAAHVLLRSADPGGLSTALDVRLPDPTLVAAGLFVAGLVGWWRGRRGAAWLIAAGLGLLLVRAPAADGRLHVSVLDVGQGESIVVRSPHGRVLVVDAGPAMARFDAGEDIVAPYLWHLGARRVDVLALSHAHPDHSGGVPGLLRAFPVGEAWEGLAPRDDAGYRAWDRSWADRAVRRVTTTRGFSRGWDGVRLDVLGPRTPGRAPWRVRNDDSLAASLAFGAVRVLLTGDLEAAGEAALDAPPADVLKVGHHGSRTSTAAPFVARVAPRLALVSVGHGNHFGHPHPDVLARLAAAGVEVFRTDRDGTVEVSTDGCRTSVCTARGGCRTVLPSPACR